MKGFALIFDFKGALPPEWHSHSAPKVFAHFLKTEQQTKKNQRVP
jgi:hypothetical protein